MQKVFVKIEEVESELVLSFLVTWTN